MRPLISFLLLFSLNAVNAANVTCIPIKMNIQNKNMILTGPDKSSVSKIYFFKNTGKEGIWIDHPSSHNMNAGWSSYLRAGNWSAFLLNRKDFAMSCALIEPGKVEYLDCSKRVTVCAPKEVAFKKNPKGTYWLVEDKSWEEMVKVVEKKGINLK